MHSWPDLLREHRGVILRRDDPSLGPALERAVTTGQLARVLPGTYVDARAAEDPLTLVAAAVRRFPGAVVVGRAAAALSFWHELQIRRVTIAGVQSRVTDTSIHFSRRLVPVDWTIVRDGITMTAPAMTAMDLAVETDGESIDCVLLTQRASLAQLAAALSAGAYRSGNRERRALLLESRNEAWSKAERITHAIMREGKFRGWVAQHPVTCGGMDYKIDIAFVKLRVAVEFDSKRFHGSNRFDYDRYRHNALVADGWIVLHLTWVMITGDRATVIRVVRAALAQGRARLAKGC